MYNMENVLLLRILCPWDTEKVLDIGPCHTSTHISMLDMYRAKEKCVVRQTSCLPKCNIRNIQIWTFDGSSGRFWNAYIIGEARAMGVMP